MQELEAKLSLLQAEKQNVSSALEVEKQSSIVAVQEIAISLEAEKQNKSSLQDALDKVHVLIVKYCIIQWMVPVLYTSLSILPT